MSTPPPTFFRQPKGDSKKAGAGAGCARAGPTLFKQKFWRVGDNTLAEQTHGVSARTHAEHLDIIGANGAAEHNGGPWRCWCQEPADRVSVSWNDHCQPALIPIASWPCLHRHGAACPGKNAEHVQNCCVCVLWACCHTICTTSGTKKEPRDN